MKPTWKVILLIMLAGFVGWRVMAQEPQGTSPSGGQQSDPNEQSGGQQSNPAAQTNSGVPISGAVTLTPVAGRGGETDGTVKGGADVSDLTIIAVPLTTDELSMKLEKARQIASEMESASIHRANDARNSMQPWNPIDLEGRDRIRKELRLFVMEAFEARHTMQRMEVALLEKKIEAMNRKLKEQGTNASEIIERRIDDLLNPNLRWDDSAIKNSTTKVTDRGAVDPNVLAPASAVNPLAFERIQEAKAVSPPAIDGAKTPAGVLAYEGIVREWIGGDRLAGTILADGAFKPVPNATIHLDRVSPITKGGGGYQFEEIEVFNSDAQGRFKINIPDDLKRFIPTPGTKEWDNWESLLLVTTSAPGFATDSTTLAANRGLDSIELIRGTSIQGRLVDKNGKPVANAHVTVSKQCRPSAQEMTEWLRQASKTPLPMANIDPSDTDAILAARTCATIARNSMQWIPTQIEGVITDQDGRFTIDGMGPDDVLDLNVECFGYNNASIKVIGRDIETVYSRDPFASGENIAVHGRTLQATLIASDRGSPHSRHRVIKGERKKVEANPSDASANDE